jgi:plasmid stabilization system protein ParE
VKYNVRALSRAQRDVDSILDWIINERHAPQGAASWLRAYEQAAKALADSPESYGFAPENGHVDIELRQFLFKTRRGRTYRGVFTIVGNEVRILRVRGPGQPLLEADEIE